LPLDNGRKYGIIYSRRVRMSPYDHTTTIRLSKELLRAARKKALEKGISLSEIIRELLKEWLEEKNDETDE